MNQMAAVGRAPVLSLDDLVNPSTSRSMIPTGARYSFLLSGITNQLSQAPFVVRMCPPLTTKNYHLYEPLLAVGKSLAITRETRSNRDATTSCQTLKLLSQD